MDAATSLPRALDAILALGLGAEGIFFHLEPKVGDCFKWSPELGHRFVGSYEADGPSEGIEVWMLGPEERELWRVRETSGKFKSVDVHNQGETYSLCFQSTSSETQMVSFDARWGHESELDLEEAGDGKDVEQIVTPNHTDQMKRQWGGSTTRFSTSQNSKSL